MTKLSIHQQSFVDFMKKDKDLENHGFERLKDRPDKEVFFDALIDADFFSPKNNPLPVKGKEDGFYHIPFWPALNYLEAMAVLASEKNDDILSKQVMTIVRSVSNACKRNSDYCDNFHTFRMLAKIVGLLPSFAITKQDIDLIPLWFKGRFDNRLASREIVTELLPKLLKSNSTDDWEKAFKVFDLCTKIDWVTKKHSEWEDKKPHTAISDHYLDQILSKSIESLAIKVPLKTANLLADRLIEVFKDTESYGSWIRRPAVEEHKQNHAYNKTENFFVAALRDVLLFWAKSKPDEARFFILKIINSDSEILRRVAIYIVSSNWKNFGDIYASNLDKNIFQKGHLHELYQLLADNFSNFSDSLQIKTVESIKNIPKSLKSSDPDRHLKYIQLDWLSSIYEKGCVEADQLYNQICMDETIEAPSEHPDFHTYSLGVTRGFGTTPYEIDELLSLVKTGQLVKKLNAFEQKDTWMGPTTRSLVDSLEKAVQEDPQAFLEIIEHFLTAKRPYQYGLINGFKKLWDVSSQKNQKISWNMAWAKLIPFFKALIINDSFWEEEIVDDGNLTPTQAWIPPLISDFLQAGTRRDEKSYDTQYLPETWRLVTILVERSEQASEAKTSDAMSQAINTSKGRAIEAMINHALRNCRVSDREKGEHKDIWQEMQPVFNKELEKCSDANFEFSTLVGCYLSNFTYMSSDWVEENFESIFNAKYLSNYECALDGLAYSPATKQIYNFLLKHKVVEISLRKKLGGEVAHEKLIERVAIAYLWGIEDLNSPRFSYLFSNLMITELVMISDVFRNVHEPDIPNDISKRVIDFWIKCVSWGEHQSIDSSKLFSRLSTLSRYIKTIGNEENKLLLAVAPYVHLDYNADDFIENLYRLVQSNPENTNDILSTLLESYVPDYDYEDKLKNLIRKLSENGFKHDAERYADKLKNQISGMFELYKEIRENSKLD